MTALSTAAAGSDFSTRVPDYLQRLVHSFNRWLPPSAEDPTRLHEAMRYACNGGKRLRALLVYAAGEALSVPTAALDAAAASVELIHAYSLVHDDLPAMDDDDLRRGQPTVHKAYDEATAILVGDSLQTLAFEILTEDNEFTTPAQRLAMVRVLALASGSRGMCGGQAVDIESEGKAITLERLQSLHARKTGALILASLRLAACAGHPTSSHAQALNDYGRAIGLAFQIQDDVLDITQSTETLGKTAGKDLAQQKSTYPSLLGLQEASRRAHATFNEARAVLQALPAGAPALTWLVDFIEKRQN
jgi:farnesyl diphosphate synthase